MVPEAGGLVPLGPPRHGRVLELPGRLVVDALAVRRLRRVRGPGARLHAEPVGVRRHRASRSSASPSSPCSPSSTSAASSSPAGRSRSSRSSSWSRCSSSPSYGIIKGTGSGFSPMLPEGESFLTSLNLGLAIMMWMYSGWESMSTLAGEIENPQKVIPKALMIGTPLVIATYFVTVCGVHPHRQPRRSGQLAQHVDGRRRRGLRAARQGRRRRLLRLPHADVGHPLQHRPVRRLPRHGRAAAVPDVARPPAAAGSSAARTRAGARRGSPSSHGLRQRGAHQLRVRRAHHHRRVPAHVPLRAHLPDGR